MLLCCIISGLIKVLLVLLACIVIYRVITQTSTVRCFSVIEKVPSHSAAGGPVLQPGSHRKSKKIYNIQSTAFCLHTLQQIYQLAMFARMIKTFFTM